MTQTKSNNNNLVTANRPSQFVGCEALGEVLLNNNDVQKVEVNYSETGFVDIILVTFTNNTKSRIEIY